MLGAYQPRLWCFGKSKITQSLCVNIGSEQRHCALIDVPNLRRNRFRGFALWLYWIYECKDHIIFLSFYVQHSLPNICLWLKLFSLDSWMPSFRTLNYFKDILSRSHLLPSHFFFFIKRLLRWTFYLELVKVIYNFISWNNFLKVSVMLICFGILLSSSYATHTIQKYECNFLPNILSDPRQVS